MAQATGLNCLALGCKGDRPAGYAYCEEHEAAYRPALRPVENGDLWAAIRGLGLMRLDAIDLERLHSEHFANQAFASRVIVAAIEQVRTMRKRGDLRYSA